MLSEQARGERPKRKRLNYACNYCRNRKTRCDEQKPSCRACLNAGVPCITTDKRRPGLAVDRYPAGSYRGGTYRGATSPRQRHAAEAAARNAPNSSSGGGDGMPAPSAALPSPQSSGVLSHSQSAPEQGDYHQLLHQYQRQAAAAQDGSAATVHLPTPSVYPGSHPSEDEANYLTGEPESAGTGRNRFTGRLPLLPRATGGGNFGAYTGWLTVALRRLGNPMAKTLSMLLSPVHVHHVPEVSICASLPELPPHADRVKLVEAYGHHVHSIFPVVDLPQIAQLAQHEGLNRAEDVIAARGWPQCLMLYLVLDLGWLHQGKPSHLQRLGSYTDFFKSVLGHVLSWNNLESVQIVLLYAILLECINNVESAWSVGQLCVSLAISMGLHQRQTPQSGTSSARPSTPNGPRNQDQCPRVWWCLFAFERILAFQLGRLSAIHDHECNQIEDWLGAQAADGSMGHSGCFVSFARMLGQISKQSARARENEERLASQQIEPAIAEKVRVIGESVLMLMKWAEALPEGLRPNSDMAFASVSDFPAKAFLSTQYHQALLVISRNSLLISDVAIRHAVEAYAVSQPWHNVIRRGQSLAVESARKIVKLIFDTIDTDLHLPVVSLLVPLHALYALAVHIIKNPASRLVNSDVDHFLHAIDYTKQRCDKFGPNRRLHSVLEELASLVSERVASSNLGSHRLSLSASSASNVMSMETPSEASYPRPEEPFHGLRGPGDPPQVPWAPPLFPQDDGLAAALAGDGDGGAWLSSPSDDYVNWDWADFGLQSEDIFQ